MEPIERATRMFLDTKASEWRMVGNAAIHLSAIPDSACRFLGPAVIRGGEFHGGEFHGGEFRGGEFRGGVFRGGEFHDGWFRGGLFLGGTFRGGLFLGGTFRGGVFHGGVFHDGWFRGGEFYQTPLQLLSALPWPVVQQADGRIAIGCECHDLSEWRRDLGAIAARHKVKNEDSQKVARVLDEFEPGGLYA